MFSFTVLILCALSRHVDNLSWNFGGVRPWETYSQLGEIQRPLGLTLNQSLPAHYHFSVGYLCLHSFMYNEAHEAFDIALSLIPTFIEAYIGKILACKQALWSNTNFSCGQTVYNAARNATNISGYSSLQTSLLSTAYLWYINETFPTVGEIAFLAAITNLSGTYPNETDIQVLKGLSLLNAPVQPINNTGNMITARQVLTDAWAKEPNHPGTLHYLIHAYDVVEVDVAEKARAYAESYGKIVNTSSHAQHMSSHIWMRTGSWNLALAADGTAILASLSLCAIKLLNRLVSISSIQLESVMNSLNITTMNQTAAFLQCDEDNRAHSMEWLAYSRLQTGDWQGSVALLRDLVFAHYRLSSLTRFYLDFAYRTQARNMIELFYWFPYKSQFSNGTDQLLALNGSQTLSSVNDNETQWYPIWSEAGLRFSECLRLLTTQTTSYNATVINDHLARLALLSNRTIVTSQYVSNSITMMINQIRGIRAYVNQSWQDCLNELYSAFQREILLVPDINSPTLVFARSSDLLAMHLLLIYDKLQQKSERTLSPRYTLNGTEININDFPARALNLYRTANLTAPNRTIGLLGMARALTKLQNYTEAARIYGLLLTQMNTSDTTFVQEVNTLISQIVPHSNSAIHNSAFFSFIFICLIFNNLFFRTE